MSKLNSTIKLFHGNIYNFIENGTSFNAIYICDTNLKDMILIVPFKPNDNISVIVNLQTFNDVAYVNETKEINISYLNDVVYIKGKPAKVLYQDYLSISEIVLAKYLNKTLNTYSTLSNLRKSLLIQ